MMRAIGPVNWGDPINWQHPLNDGLVGWWLNTPNSQGGTVLRDLVGRNDGTLANMNPATDWVKSNRPGGWGALDFDGSDDDVSLPAGIVNVGSEHISAFMWVNLRTKNGTGNQVLLQQTGSSGRTWLYRDISPLNVLGSSIGGFPTNSVQTVFANTGEWHFVGVTYDQVTVRLYIDGMLAGSGVQTGESETGGFLIGKHKSPSTSSEEWNGPIDDLHIYNRILFGTEPWELYQLSRKFYPGLLRRLERRAVKAGAAPSTTIPIMDHHYRMMRVG